jgi:hypothetical protein
LLRASAGIFLLSPVSLKRPWINFELGALWMRNVAAKQRRENEMPLIPICHSGLEIKSLPMPISQLNAVMGNNSASLRIAFDALQIAVRGGGELKTVFDDIAGHDRKFEIAYTIGSAFRDIWTSLIREFDDMTTKTNIISVQINCCRAEVHR